MNTPALPISAIASPLQKSYKVTRAELPISCPLPNTPLWNLHPRVFLTFSDNGRTQCPYCGAEYILAPVSS